MHPYLLHLLSDLRNAHRPETDDGESNPHAFLEQELEDMENWLGREPEVSFGQYCGLTVEQFPPVELWSTAELSEIVTEFWHMMFSWGVDADLPDDLPLPLAYGFLVRTLDEKIFLMPEGGFTIIEFCENEPMECVFGTAYCTCQKYFDAAEQNRESSLMHDRVTELVWEIRERLGELPENLEFCDAVAELGLSPGCSEPVFKPLWYWLGVETEKIPPVSELTDWECSELASELLRPFDSDDDLAAPIRCVPDPARRYSLALELYALPVRHDGFGRFGFQPSGKWEQLPEGLASPLDFLNLGDGEGEGTDGDADKGLPF